MRINKNDNVYGYDVDQTIISKRRTETNKHADDLCVVNPYTNEKVYFKPIERHINLLKEMKGRGRYIRVHTAAGVEWAVAIIKVLGIEEYVDDVETKMVGYIDDKPVEHWLSNRIWLDEDER